MLSDENIGEELYQMIMNQKEGCNCHICCLLFVDGYRDLINEIIDDIKKEEVNK